MSESCVRSCFYVFSVLSCVLGILLLLLTLLFQIINKDEDISAVSLVPLYLVGGATVAVAVLGGVGAYKESKVCLIIFLVCVVVGALITLKFGVIILVARPHLEQELRSEFRTNLPLDRATEDVKSMTEILQKDMFCCGLFSSDDWQEIPESCLCIQEEAECQNILVNIDESFQTIAIYKEPCFPILVFYVLLVTDISVGVSVFTMVLAMVGVVLASITIHRMNRALRTAGATGPAQHVSYTSSGVSWS